MKSKGNSTSERDIGRKNFMRYYCCNIPLHIHSPKIPHFKIVYGFDTMILVKIDMPNSPRENFNTEENVDVFKCSVNLLDEVMKGSNSIIHRKLKGRK